MTENSYVTEKEKNIVKEMNPLVDFMKPFCVMVNYAVLIIFNLDCVAGRENIIV